MSRLASGAPDAHIALVMAAGTIAEGKSRNSAERREVLGAETLIKALREVRNRSSVDAIVLRVDSPGGFRPGVGRDLGGGAALRRERSR